MSKVKMYRAIIIDAEKREVYEVFCETETLGFMQDVVGGLITVGHEFANRDTVYVDDEGLLKGYQHFFELEGAHQPFAGNGVIFGCTQSGNTTSTLTPLEEVRAKVKFIKFIGRAALQFKYSEGGGE